MDQIEILQKLLKFDQGISEKAMTYSYIMLVENCQFSSNFEMAWWAIVLACTDNLEFLFMKLKTDFIRNHVEVSQRIFFQLKTSL